MGPVVALWELKPDNAESGAIDPATATVEGTMTASDAPLTDAANRISDRIRELGDWRGETLARVRTLIHEADPEVIEEWKWRGVPVWSHDGLICTGETYREIVKLTFFKGASLEDRGRLFNAGLDGNARRAIDLYEGDELDSHAFQALIREAVEFNQAHRPKRRR